MPVQTRRVVDAHEVPNAGALPTLNYVYNVVISHTTLVPNRIVGTGLQITRLIVVVSKVFVHWVPHLHLSSDAVGVARPVYESLVVLEVDASVVYSGRDTIVPIVVATALEENILHSGNKGCRVIVRRVQPQPCHATGGVLGVRKRRGCSTGGGEAECNIPSGEANASMKPGNAARGLNTKVLGETPHEASSGSPCGRLTDIRLTASDAQIAGSSAENVKRAVCAINSSASNTRCGLGGTSVGGVGHGQHGVTLFPTSDVQEGSSCDSSSSSIPASTS